MSLFYVILLVTGVSIDALAAGTAYGLKNIQVPLLSLIVIGTISGLFTAGAMISAQLFSGVVNSPVVAVLGAILLLTLGCWYIITEYLARITNKYDKHSDKLTHSLGEMFIDVVAMADIDKSNSISCIEAIFLGIALGMDNMIATFAASMLGNLPTYTPLIMACAQSLLIFLGIQMSTCCIPNNIKHGLPYIPGVVLIIIGVTRLV